MFTSTRRRAPAAVIAAAAIIVCAPRSSRAAVEDSAEAVAADYTAAAALLRPWSMGPKLKNARIVPHWIGSSDEFWYLRDTQSGTEFVIADAEPAPST